MGSRSEFTRTRIEEATLSLLGEEGLDGFTAARLAARAGISKANIYHHYENLDEVLLASFERMVAGMPALSPPPGTGFRDWLTGLGDALIAMPPAARPVMRAYLAFFSRAMIDVELRSRVRKALESTLEGIAATLDQIGPPHLSPSDRLRLARLILVAGDGFLMHAQMTDAQHDDLSAAWVLFVDALQPKEHGS